MLLTETLWHVFYISKLPSLSFKETSSSLTTFLLTGKAPEIRYGGLISLFHYRRIYTPESPSKEKWSRQSQPVVERVFKSFTSVKKIIIPHCKKKKLQSKCLTYCNVLSTGLKTVSISPPRDLHKKTSLKCGYFYIVIILKEYHWDFLINPSQITMQLKWSLILVGSHSRLSPWRLGWCT